LIPFILLTLQRPGAGNLTRAAFAKIGMIANDQHPGKFQR
jgi:hypothetical protein